MENQQTDHEHLSFVEMERYFALDAEKPSSSDVVLLQKVVKSLDSCSVCRRRYQFFVNTEAISSFFASEKNDNKVAQHEHVSLNDIEQVNYLDEADVEDVSDADWNLFLEVHKRVDGCSICWLSYKLYEIYSLLSAFSSEKDVLSDRTATGDRSIE